MPCGRRAGVTLRSGPAEAVLRTMRAVGDGFEHLCRRPRNPAFLKTGNYATTGAQTPATQARPRRAGGVFAGRDRRMSVAPPRGERALFNAARTVARWIPGGRDFTADVDARRIVAFTQTPVQSDSGPWPVAVTAFASPDRARAIRFDAERTRLHGRRPHRPLPRVRNARQRRAIGRMRFQQPVDPQEHGGHPATAAVAEFAGDVVRAAQDFP